MPVFEYKLREELKKRGIDPDSAELVDDAEEQSANISSPTIKPKSSTFGATARSFATGVLPTTAGLVGGSLAAAPFTGGASIPVGLIAGIATSILAGKGQQKAIEAISPEFAQQLQTDVEQHPIATTIGSLASALPTLRPGIKSLPSAGRAIRDIITPGIRPHATDIGNLLNVGLGSTIQPSIRLATDPELRKKALAGDPESLAILGMETVGGGLLNDPRKWTKSIGLHPNVYREDIFKGAREAQKPDFIDVESEKIPEEIKLKSPLETEPVIPGYEKAEVVPTTESGAIGELKQREIKAKNEAIQLKKVAAAESKSQNEAKRLAKIYQTGDKNVAEYFGIDYLKDFQPLSNEAKGRLREGYKYELQQAKLEKEATAEPVVSKKEELKPEETKIPFAEEKLIEQQKEDDRLKYLIEATGEKQVEGPSKLKEREGIYSEEEQSKLSELAQKRTEPLVKGAEKEGLILKPTNALFGMFQKLGVLRNMKLIKDRVFKSDGTEVKGQAILRNGLEEAIAKVNPETGTIETAPHELGHIFRDDLLKHGNDSEKKIVTKGDRIIEASPEYQEWKSARKAENKESSIEEYYNTHVGEDSIRRVLKTDGDGKFKSFLKDFWSAVKVKYGNPESKDFVRLMSNKLINDAPFKETFGKDVQSKVPLSSIEETRTPEARLSEEETQPSKEQLIFDRIPDKTGIPGITQEGLQEPIMDFKNSSLDEQSYWKFLTKVKGYTKAEANEQLNKFRTLQNERPGNFIPKYSEEEYNKLPTAPVKYSGKFEGDEMLPSFHNYNLTEDISGHPKDSTLAQATLANKGYRIPNELEQHSYKEMVENSDKLNKLKENLGKFSEEEGSKLPKKEYKTPVEQLEESKHPIDKEILDQLHIVKNINTEGRKVVITRDSFDKNSSEYQSAKFKVEKLKQDYKKAIEKLKQLWGPEDVTKQSEEEGSKLPKYSEKEIPKLRMLPQTKEAVESSSNPKQEETKLKNFSTPWGLKFLTPRIDKIAEQFKNNTGNYVSNQLHKWWGWTDQLAGQIGNKQIANFKDANFTEAEHSSLVKYLYDMDSKGNSDVKLNTKQEDFVSKYLENIREPKLLQRELGLKVAGRLAGIKEDGYFPNMLDNDVAYNWSEKSDSEQSKTYDKLYTDFLEKNGLSKEDALAQLKDYKDAIGHHVSPDVEFGAIRKAEGLGLPFELIEKNLPHLMSRYASRAARDLGYFKFLQNDPKMRKAFNLQDQFGNRDKTDLAPDIEHIGGAKVSKDALASVLGADRSTRNPKILAISRIVNNVLMGVGTPIRNLVNIPGFISTYVRPGQIPLIFKAFGNMNDSAARAFENNSIRASFADYDTAGDFVSSPDPFIRRLSEGSYILRKYQGRNLSDKLEGWYIHTLGELLAKDNLAAAKNGDKEAVRLSRRFGDTLEGGVDKLFEKNAIVKDEHIQAIAKRFTDAVRGTYGPEGVPTWTSEGGLSFFTQLSRFNIEKANTIWKDAILPIKEGSYGPLLRTALGGILTGAAIEQINELLSGKRSVDPTITEVEKFGSPVDVGAKVIGLWQLASIAGIISDFSKVGSNLAQGKGIKYNNPLSFPLYSFATDVLAKNTSDLVNSIQDGDDPIESLASYIQALAQQSSQTYRYVDANFVNPELAKRKEAFRDLRIFKELDSGDIPQGTGELPNVIGGKKLKEFKQSSDLEIVAKLLPELIDKALEKSKDNSGNVDPFVLKKELQKIKENNYQTMPSPTDMPIKFVKFISFLEKSQGKEAAASRLQDYLLQNLVNKEKSKLVPSL